MVRCLNDGSRINCRGETRNSIRDNMWHLYIVPKTPTQECYCRNIHKLQISTSWQITKLVWIIMERDGWVVFLSHSCWTKVVCYSLRGVKFIWNNIHNAVSDMHPWLLKGENFGKILHFQIRESGNP
jgi:hypothetical protein